MATGIYVGDGDILLHLLPFYTTLIYLVKFLIMCFVSAANLEK